MYLYEIHVENYRSLKNLTIKNLKPFVIFYGQNDTGKSNILNFLELIFSQKYSKEETAVTDETKIISKPTGFWKGEIDNFRDNLFKNLDESILFEIKIKIEKKEIFNGAHLNETFLKSLSQKKRNFPFIIKGKINQGSSPDKGKIILTNVEFDKKSFYSLDEKGNDSYLKNYKIDASIKYDTFEKVMSLLDNSFIRIPNNRFVGIEKELPRDDQVKFSPNFLKNWLFQQKLSRENDKLFHSINSKFSSEPFLHGEISVARIGDDEIEIFITDGSGLKLPIGRKGTGVQQILMILSYIAQYDSPFVGIEELETNLSPKSQNKILKNLFNLVYQGNDTLINQVFLTTHSPYMATNVSDKIDRRLVSMNESGETKVSDPTEEDDFFTQPSLLLV